jgi:hypothetical protein
MIKTNNLFDILDSAECDTNPFGAVERLASVEPPRGASSGRSDTSPFGAVGQSDTRRDELYNISPKGRARPASRPILGGNDVKLLKKQKNQKFEFEIDPDIKNCIINSINIMEKIDQEDEEKKEKEKIEKDGRSSDTNPEGASIEDEDEIIEPLPCMPQSSVFYVKEVKEKIKKEEKLPTKKLKDIKYEQKIVDMKNKIKNDMRHNNKKNKINEKQYIKEMEDKLVWLENISKDLPDYVKNYISRKLKDDECINYDGVHFYKYEEISEYQKRIEMTRIDMLLEGCMTIQEFSNKKFAKTPVVIESFEKTLYNIRNLYIVKNNCIKPYKICRNLEGCTKRDECQFAHTKDEFKPHKCRYNTKCSNKDCVFIHDLESIDTLLGRYKRIYGYSFPPQKTIERLAVSTLRSPSKPVYVSSTIAPWGKTTTLVNSDKDSLVKDTYRGWGYIPQITVKFKDVLYQEKNKLHKSTTVISNGTELKNSSSRQLWQEKQSSPISRDVMCKVNSKEIPKISNCWSMTVPTGRLSDLGGERGREAIPPVDSSQKQEKAETIPQISGATSSISNTCLKTKFCNLEIQEKCMRKNCNWAHHFSEMSFCRYDDKCRMKDNICIFKHTGENGVDYITRIKRTDIPLRMLADATPIASLSRSDELDPQVSTKGRVPPSIACAHQPPRGAVISTPYNTPKPSLLGESSLSKPPSLLLSIALPDGPFLTRGAGSSKASGAGIASRPQRGLEGTESLRSLNRPDGAGIQTPPVIEQSFCLPPPPLKSGYKVKFCNFHLSGFCGNGVKCSWAHYVDEIPTCRFGNECNSKFKCIFRHPVENSYEFARRLNIKSNMIFRNISSAKGRVPPGIALLTSPSGAGIPSSGSQSSITSANRNSVYRGLSNMGVTKLSSAMDTNTIIKMQKLGELSGQIIRF